MPEWVALLDLGSFGMGLLLALASMIALGVSNYLYKKSVLAIGANHSIFFYYVFALIIAGIFWYYVRDDKSYETSQLVWPLLLAVFLFISHYTFMLSLEHITVSVSSTFRGLSFLVTIVLAVSLASETLAPKDYLATGLAVLAIIIFGLGNSSGPDEAEATKVDAEVAEKQ